MGYIQGWRKNFFFSRRYLNRLKGLQNFDLQNCNKGKWKEFVIQREYKVEDVPAWHCKCRSGAYLFSSSTKVCQPLCFLRI